MTVSAHVFYRYHDVKANTFAFLSMPDGERRQLVQRTLQMIFEKQKGTACTVTAARIARMLRLSPLPVILSLIKFYMLTYPEIKYDGRVWRVVAVEPGRHCVRIRYSCNGGGNGEKDRGEGEGV